MKRWLIVGAMIPLVLSAATMTRLHLQKTGVVQVLGQPAARIITGGVKADPEGNAYLQPFAGAQMPAVVLKVSGDGRRVTRFELQRAPKFAGAMVMDYAVCAEGEVAMLVLKSNVELPYAEPYIVLFNKDGSYDSAIKLAGGEWQPRRLGVFSSGAFLVSGWWGSPDFGGRPWAGIFDQSGRFVTDIKLKSDMKLPDDKLRALQDRSTVPPKEVREALTAFKRTVDTSLIAAGDDGNLYLARRTPEGPIWVVSPGGQTLRTFRLQAPEKDAELMDIKLAHGRIVALYIVGPFSKLPPGTPHTVILCILDSRTGEELAQYGYADNKIGNSLISCVPEEFTFLGSDDDGNMQLIKAAPR